MFTDAPRLAQLFQALDLVSAESIDCLLERSVNFVSESLEHSRCSIWWMDTIRNGLYLRFAHGITQTESFSGTFIPYDVGYEAGLFRSDHVSEVELDNPVRSLRGCIFSCIRYDERTNGLIAVSRTGPSVWTEHDKAFLGTVASSISAGCRRLDHGQKTAQLLDSLRTLGEATYEAPLANIALESGKRLLMCDRAVLRRINLKTGQLDFERSTPKPDRPFALAPGEGIAGLSLKDKRPYRIDDVTAPEWKLHYRPLWKGSRSELAVPILLPNARIRVATKLAFVDKPFGVLNFESPALAAFSPFDQECIMILTQHVARAYERFEFDKKLARLRKVERSMAGFHDWAPSAIADKVMEEIRDTLGFEYVSLSIVNRESNVIRCYRVLGLENPAEFRKAAVHDLNGSNIQAEVVRTKKIEVPSAEDPRLDRLLSERFGLGKLVRVFIPVLAYNKEGVLGTVSAGYNREHRPYVYERDIQILRGFVDFTSAAMEARRWDDVTLVSHEMNAPLSALRGNLSRLQQHHKTMHPTKVDRVLEDMATDATTLYYEVQLLEYIWAGRSGPLPKRPLNIEPVLFFRDLIFKTIQELKPMVRDKKLDPARVSYDEADVYKIRTVHVDKSKISQVIFNLFVNAIKYSDNPETFQIRIGAEEQEDCYVVKFCDWGIGIPEGLEQRIFEKGFRAPSVQNSVSGSGLGLTIARQIMREHGGDLVLKNRAKPTQFDIVIPKAPPEMK